MRFELFFAKRLQLNKQTNNGRSAVSTLNVAITGMILAIVIMVVAVSVVTGFKSTIINKITNLDSHIKIFNKHLDSSDNMIRSYIDFNSELSTLLSSKADPRIKSVYLISEIPCVLKSPDGFSGLRFKGVSDSYDLSYLRNTLTAGKADISGNNVLVSKATADKLQLHIGDRLYIYFMNNQQVRMRRCNICGIFNTDFDTFDEHILIGNLKTLQSVNQWDASTGSYIGVDCKSGNDIDDVRDYHRAQQNKHHWRTQSAWRNRQKHPVDLHRHHDEDFVQRNHHRQCHCIRTASHSGQITYNQT